MPWVRALWVVTNRAISVAREKNEVVYTAGDKAADTLQSNTQLRSKANWMWRYGLFPGIIMVLVDEGAKVSKQGQTLFILDQVQYLEAVNAAKSAVAMAEAQGGDGRANGQKQLPTGERRYHRRLCPPGERKPAGHRPSLLATAKAQLAVKAA